VGWEASAIVVIFCVWARLVGAGEMTMLNACCQDCWGCTLRGMFQEQWSRTARYFYCTVRFSELRST
jgi:hypothetical protein